MLIFIFLVFVIILIYFTYLFFKKSERFHKQIRLIEFWGILIAMLFAIISFDQTNESIKNSTDDFNALIDTLGNIIGEVKTSRQTLDSVKSSLSELPKQLDNFSNSISSLNKVVYKQEKQLFNSLNKLNSSILNFKSSVNAMVKRFNRKPELDMDFSSSKDDTSITIKELIIKNKGTLLADIYMVAIQIYNYNNLINFEMKGFKKRRENLDYIRYQYDGENNYLTPDPTKPLRINSNINFHLKESIIMRVIVYYKAAFGNDGNIMFMISGNPLSSKIVK